MLVVVGGSSCIHKWWTSWLESGAGIACPCASLLANLNLI